MPDPKIDTLRREIQDLVRKRNVAAVVFLASPTHTNFLYEVTPSWSCARLEPGPEGCVCIRVRSKRVDYPSDQAQKEDLQRTIGMFLGLAEACESAAANFTRLAMLVGQKTIIEHSSRLEPPEG